jgi:hypothetical protein
MEICRTAKELLRKSIDSASKSKKRVTLLPVIKKTNVSREPGSITKGKKEPMRKSFQKNLEPKPGNGNGE